MAYVFYAHAQCGHIIYPRAWHGYVSPYTIAELPLKAHTTAPRSPSTMFLLDRPVHAPPFPFPPLSTSKTLNVGFIVYLVVRSLAVNNIVFLDNEECIL